MEMTFLNNFYTILRTQLFGNTYAVGQLVTESTSTGLDHVLGALKDTNGNDISQLNLVYNSSSSAVNGYMTNRFGFFKNNNLVGWSSMNYFGVGNGRTAVSMSDNELAAPITSGISISRTAATNVDGIVHNVIVHNAGSADVTVSEIGLYDLVHVRSTSSASNPAERNVLVARAVLDNDVVIPGGESKTFDVSLSLALPAQL